MLQKILVVVLAVASLWDGFTTMYGTSHVLGDGCGQVFAAFLFGILISALLLNTKRIIEGNDDFQGNVSRLLWFLALAYDLYTSWLGNANFLVPNGSGVERGVILTGLTVLVSGSPVLLSYHLDRWE